MSHQHICPIEGHYWQCEGMTLRPGDTEPSVCMCVMCDLPLEGFDHSKCGNFIELVACPKHHEEELRGLAVAREVFRRRAAEFGLSEKCERLQSLAEGPEKDALLREIKEWILQNCDDQHPEV